MSLSDYQRISEVLYALCCGAFLGVFMVLIILVYSASSFSKSEANVPSTLIPTSDQCHVFIAGLNKGLNHSKFSYR